MPSKQSSLLKRAEPTNTLRYAFDMCANISSPLDCIYERSNRKVGFQQRGLTLRTGGTLCKQTLTCTMIRIIKEGDGKNYYLNTRYQHISKITSTMKNTAQEYRQIDHQKRC